MRTHATWFGVTIFLLVSGLFIPSDSRAENANHQFENLAHRWWEDKLRRDPLFATTTGDHRFGDRLPEISEAAVADQIQQTERFLRELQRIDAAALDPTNRINMDIVRHMLETDLVEAKFGMAMMPITNRSGFHIEFPEIRHQTPFQTTQDVHNYLKRLRAFPTYVQGQIDLMRGGIEKQLTLPSAVLQQYRNPIEAHLVDAPKESVFFSPFVNLPNSFTNAEKTELQQAAKDAITAGILPGYRAFLAFMESEYVPSARGSLGTSALPGGREFYRHRVRRFTTLNLTPEEVHQLGQSEVHRISIEMEAVMKSVEFTGSIRDFADQLREDPRFHADTAEHLLQTASLILKRMDGKLPLLFGKLPRTPYGLKPIPDYLAPQTTTAYYMPPPGDGGRAGFYYLNTYDLKARPLYGLEALSLHEAVPGHHLQLALQQELTDVPAYRRFSNLTVFVEGWALYAERLGLEVGFYQDPYTNFGRLTYEMWRACRLVVDTGIHYFGWTREQAVEFMANHTALSLHNIRSEVDRYIAWPGQALAYKLGELKIVELRKKSEQLMGVDFDVKEFHDVILMNGSVSLPTLEQIVDAWLADYEQRRQPSSLKSEN